MGWFYQWFDFDKRRFPLSVLIPGRVGLSKNSTLNFMVRRFALASNASRISKLHNREVAGAKAEESGGVPARDRIEK